MRLLCKTNLDESHHDFGEITYCTKCCWKRINLKSNETVHEDSICWCKSHVKKHKSLIMRLCIKQKVLSTFCKFCTSINQNGDTIYHLYKFADDDETDYDQFYMCPIVEGEKKIPPVSFNKTCTNCGETNPTCTCCKKVHELMVLECARSPQVLMSANELLHKAMHTIKL